MFGRKSKSPLDFKPGQPIYGMGDTQIIPAQPQYETVLEWLVGLSDDDYVKVMEVAGIQRKAYKDSQTVLGDPVEPSTFIKPPVMVAPESMAERYSDREKGEHFLSDDDDLTAAFLDDDDPGFIETETPTKGKKINVKGKG